MRACFFILLIIKCQISIASIQLAGPSDFRDYLPSLQAGDTLYLIPGMYSLSLRIENIQGTSEQPILISGQPGQAKPVFIGNSCCNTVSLTKTAYLHLRDIVCDGQAIVGIDAIKAEGSTGNWTHHIQIEDFQIINYGADQQNVGISTKCPSWDWWVHHNEIVGAGTGMYFGNSNGEEPFVHSIIEYNLIQNTVGYNCQVKHQNLNTRDLTLGMPASGKTIIRYNVFSKKQNASMGDQARPNLLVGNFPGSGAGSNDHYEIYGNLFFQNPSEALFQGTGNFGFYNNLLFNTLGGWGISVQSHNGFQPREINVFCNTVVSSAGSGLAISGVNASYTQRVWANAVFSPNAISGGQQTQNVSGTFPQASQFLNAPSLPPESMDLSPIISMLEISAIDLNIMSLYSSHDVDFDGMPRDGTRAGAYKSSTPQWPLQLAIRPTVDTQTISPNTEIYLKSSSIHCIPVPLKTMCKLKGC